MAKRIPLSYPSLSLGLAAGVDYTTSYVIIEDEQSLATLKADIATRVHGIIETIIIPEIKKEFDEKKNIYSDNYVEIIGGYYDLNESKLDILVTKIPPDYGCDAQSCAHRIVTVDLPAQLRPSQIRQISLGIAVHQNMGPSDDGKEYDMFVDRVLKKASEEAKILSSEAANVLEDNKERLLEDDTAIGYLSLRQYTDLSRVSVLFGSLQPDASCAIYCQKPIDVVITSNSNYERLWAYESSFGTGQHNTQMESSAGDYEISMQVSGSPIVFDEPHQPIPFLANGTDYAFNISFMENSDLATSITNVDYNVEIFVEGVKVFDAAEDETTNNETSNTLHSTDGNATLNYSFDKLGFAEVSVSIHGIDSEPVENTSTRFQFQIEDSRVIPEFPVAQIAAAISIATVIAVFARKSFFRNS